MRLHAFTVTRTGRGSHDVYNDLIIAADTETSKTAPNEYRIIPGRKGRPDKKEYIPHENIIVAWTLSIRKPGVGNICTLYGSRPSEFCAALSALSDTLPGDKTAIYFHNLAYDWVFLETFLIDLYGEPVRQLNTKAHYPISIEFESGIIFKDSLILSQKGLERWAEELDVEHKKAVGLWDYDRFRGQSGGFTPEELEYIEHDTLALVECLDRFRIQLRKKVYSIPLTCTGIIREETRKEGKKNRARNRFERMAPDFELYRKLLAVYHGGFTHNNRHAAGWLWPDAEAIARGDLPTCYDFSSSYPFRMLVDLYPRERFRRIGDKLDPAEVLRYADSTAFVFKLILVRPELKDYRNPMPCLQLSKTITNVNSMTDNGRILAADYVEIYLNEVDLSLIASQYTWEAAFCVDVYAASKGPLPRWFRDLVYKCYNDKCKLKGGDPVEYALSKAKLNSLYGMCCSKSIRPVIVEDYKTGEFRETEILSEEDYQKYLDNYNNILPYFWGVWVTSYAQAALFALGACVKPEAEGGLWLYSDTDSVYALGWDPDKLSAYNEDQKERLRAAGYGPVIVDGREFWPGVAELDGIYKEFIGLHSKCYAVRKMDGKIKITVAGVPKKGAVCLGDDLSKFKDGFIFPGEETGKLTHYYLYRNESTIEDGIEKGNSVDLAPCDYEIGLPVIDDLFEILATKESEIQTFEE